MRRGFSRGAAGGQGSHGGAPGEMAAFMAIASQRPIVGRLGSGSNLAKGGCWVLYPARAEILCYSVDRWLLPYIKASPPCTS